MESYTYIPAVHVRPVEVSYGEASFKNFSVREVFIDNKQKGEYHIKINNVTGPHLRSAVLFFMDKLSGCDVGLIDSMNALNLEHHIYVKTFNQMKIISMMSIMESLDGDLSKKLE